MSVSELTKQTNTRLPKIKRGLLERWTREQIGVTCHVTERTIRRDIEQWTQTLDFERWLNEAWLHEYQFVDHSEAFRALTALMGKKITRKIESYSYQEIDERITIDTTEDEATILSKAARILDRKRKFEQIH